MKTNGSPYGYHNQGVHRRFGGKPGSRRPINHSPAQPNKPVQVQTSKFPLPLTCCTCSTCTGSVLAVLSQNFTQSRNLVQYSSCACALANWCIRSKHEVIPRFAPADNKRLVMQCGVQHNSLNLPGWRHDGPPTIVVVCLIVS